MVHDVACCLLSDEFAMDDLCVRTDFISVSRVILLQYSALRT